MEREKLKQIFPRASTSFLNANDQLSTTVIKRHPPSALGGSKKGKEEGLERAKIKFTFYRTRPLDPDNAQGSVKDLLDGLRHAHVIAGDEWWRIIVETSQEKVGHKWQEGTKIEIYQCT